VATALDHTCFSDRNLGTLPQFRCSAARNSRPHLSMHLCNAFEGDYYQVCTEITTSNISMGSNSVEFDEAELVDFENGFDFDFSDLVSVSNWADSPGTGVTSLACESDSTSSDGKKFTTIRSLQSPADMVICDIGNLGTMMTKTTRRNRSTGNTKAAKAVRESKQNNSRKMHPFLGIADLKPNMSRGNKSYILYAFPSFDKADALLYFPNTFSRHMNSGDVPSLTKLMLGHMDKQCEVSVSPDIPLLNGHSVLQLLCLINDLRPDLMMCVHSTKVVENQIYATAYSKVTDVPAVYDSVGHSITNPLFRMMFARQRRDRFRSVLQRAAERQPEEEVRKVESMVESGEDILLYSALDMVLTFDDVTKKIKHLQLHTQITSAHPCVSKPPCDDL